MTDRPHETERLARRDVVGAALLGAAGGMLVGPRQATGAAPQGAPSGATRKALTPPGAPAADSGYSPAILSTGGQLLFISGQGPADYDADMETQIRQTLDRIGLLLKEANASFANVVMLRSYWVHIARDLPIFRKVRKDYLKPPYPASTAVGTPQLAIPELELEIEAIAVI